MEFMKKTLLGAVAALGVTVAAQAAPLPPASTVGQNLIAGGTTITAGYLFFDANDDSDLDVSVGGGPNGFLFSNRGANASTIGDTQTFAASIGDLLTFILSNVTVGGVYTTGIGSTNVAYISNPADASVVNTALGITLSGAAVTTLNGLLANGPTVVVAFEDRPLGSSDKDFNDLIFAFSPTSTVVPEPATLALFGAGLLGLGLARRRRRA